MAKEDCTMRVFRKSDGHRSPCGKRIAAHKPDVVLEVKYAYCFWKPNVVIGANCVCPALF